MCVHQERGVDVQAKLEGLRVTEGVIGCAFDHLQGVHVGPVEAVHARSPCLPLSPRSVLGVVGGAAWPWERRRGHFSLDGGLGLPTRSLVLLLLLVSLLGGATLRWFHLKSTIRRVVDSLHGKRRAGHLRRVDSKRARNLVPELSCVDLVHTTMGDVDDPPQLLRVDLDAADDASTAACGFWYLDTIIFVSLNRRLGLRGC
mmetsp:Transcript_59304/g.140014  ORF Transcript_59304/g.140014 Transcript_59304/m.140014 type:complete len:201 (+) Transcript_59304:1731-2333(+)